MNTTPEPSRFSSKSNRPSSPPAPGLDRILERLRLRARRRVAWLRKLWEEEGEPGGSMVVTHEEIHTYLLDRDNPSHEQRWYEGDEQLREINHAIRTLEAELEADPGEPLNVLRERLELGRQEFDLLQVCLAPELDPSFGRIYAYLNDHAGRPFPTLDLAARLCGHGRGARIRSDSPLYGWQAVRVHEAPPGEPSPLTCDGWIRDWLLGQDVLDPTLEDRASRLTARSPMDGWPLEKTLTKLKPFLQSDRPPVRVLVQGSPRSGRKRFASVVSEALGLSLIVVDTHQLSAEDWTSLYLRAHRQAWLDHSAIGWSGNRSLESPWPKVPSPVPIQFVVVEDDRVPPDFEQGVDLRVELPGLSVDDRVQLLKKSVPASSRCSAEELEAFASRHLLELEDIQALSRADVRSIEDASRRARQNLRDRLGELAQRLVTSFEFEDLVVRPGLEQALRDLLFEASDRTRFWEDPGKRRLFPQGRGLLTLFNGPPGTGKTMAAQVIARELGLDCYRIDLSSVVSKYVGETSKNLRRILDRARGMDAVLLFDEADALFGKRTEVKDAHDRFANTDTGYLLQAIENYRGLAVLTTNRKSNIDPAFIRRLRYMLDFNRPDANLRFNLWTRLVGELAGSSERERLLPVLKALAEHLELTGSQIKFSILSALFAARHEKQLLNTEHLLKGIDRELMKEGRVLSDREREALTTHGT